MIHEKNLKKSLDTAPLSKILSASVSVNNYHDAVPVALMWKISICRYYCLKILRKKCWIMLFYFLFKDYFLLLYSWKRKIYL
jgi:hypothetical protein